MIIDTITRPDGMAYTLSLQNNGDFTITDSDGRIQELVGIAQAEAYEIFYSQYGYNHSEALEKIAVDLQRYGIEMIH